MKNANTITNVVTKDHWTMVVKNPFMFLAVMGLAAIIAMTATFGPVSADGATHRLAGDYTVSPPVIAGPPVVENGVATIAGKVDLEIRGSQVGTALIDFTCALGADGAPNVCQGTYLFEGTIRGESGTYSAT